MPKAVLDTTVLVSAFLRPVDGGASFDLLRFAEQGAFELCISDDILEETAQTLLTHRHIRRRYRYPDAAIVEYCRELARFATLISDPPEVRIVRDPNDDAIVACAVAAGADYLVTRDKDLLSIKAHQDIAVINPEAFLALLRR